LRGAAVPADGLRPAGVHRPGRPLRRGLLHCRRGRLPEELRGTTGRGTRLTSPRFRPPPRRSLGGDDGVPHSVTPALLRCHLLSEWLCTWLGLVVGNCCLCECLHQVSSECFLGVCLGSIPAGKLMRCSSCPILSRCVLQDYTTCVYVCVCVRVCATVRV